MQRAKEAQQAKAAAKPGALSPEEQAMLERLLKTWPNQGHEDRQA